MRARVDSRARATFKIPSSDLPSQEPEGMRRHDDPPCRVGEGATGRSRTSQAVDAQNDDHGVQAHGSIGNRRALTCCEVGRTGKLVRLKRL
jgi:hypothetical protein